MQEAASWPLATWESFYVIVGSSAAALTGLQFVVMVLVAEARRRSTFTEIDAFGTPTVVHFAAVLLLSATLSAPWRTLTGAAAVLGACGLAGVGYVALTMRRAKRQKGYQPVLEDWVWHVLLPFVAYAVLAGSAPAVARHSTDALFSVGAVAVLLLFIGIHNAWDTVTYIAVERVHGGAAAESGRPP